MKVELIVVEELAIKTAVVITSVCPDTVTDLVMHVLVAAIIPPGFIILTPFL